MPETSDLTPRPITLDSVSLRVLGALMEKEMTTPDLYPLSINALIAAANQRSSRDPVMNLTEEQIRTALYALEVATLAVQARGEGRVVRFEHRIRTVLNLRRDETAVLCLLLLRGPQTPGELRSRSERLFPFEDLAQVHSTLERMSAREVPVVTAMERTPGSREVRFRHLLGLAESESATRDHGQRSSIPSPVGALEEIAELRHALQLLEERVRRLEATQEPGS